MAELHDRTRATQTRAISADRDRIPLAALQPGFDAVTTPVITDAHRKEASGVVTSATPEILRYADPHTDAGLRPSMGERITKAGVCGVMCIWPALGTMAATVCATGALLGLDCDTAARVVWTAGKYTSLGFAGLAAAGFATVLASPFFYDGKKVAEWLSAGTRGQG